MTSYKVGNICTGFYVINGDNSLAPISSSIYFRMANCTVSILLYFYPSLMSEGFVRFFNYLKRISTDRSICEFDGPIRVICECELFMLHGKQHCEVIRGGTFMVVCGGGVVAMFMMVDVYCG